MVILFQLIDQRGHLRNVTRGARRDFRAFATERVKIFPERLDVFRSVIVKRLVLLLRLRNDAIVHVSEVHHLGHAIAFEFQITAHHVSRDRRTKVPDVPEVPDGGPAIIHAHFAFLERAKFFELTRERVVNAEHWKGE